MTLEMINKKKYKREIDEILAAREDLVRALREQVCPASIIGVMNVFTNVFSNDFTNTPNILLPFIGFSTIARPACMR